MLFPERPITLAHVRQFCGNLSEDPESRTGSKRPSRRLKSFLTHWAS